MTSKLGLFSGARAVFSGARRLLREPELRALAVAPVLLTAVVYTLGLVGAAVYSDDLVALAWAQPEGAWARAGWMVLVAVAFLALVVVLSLLFVALATALAGPFHERLALRVLGSTGVERRDLPFFHGLAVDIAWALTFAVPAGFLGLLALIPGVGVVFAVSSVTVAALGLAGASMGPAVSARGGGYRARFALFWRHFRYLAGAAPILAIGVVVPVLGLVVVPAAVIGLTEDLARAGALPS